MAEEEKPAEESAASPPAAAPKRGRLPVIAGGAVALLLLAGGGTFFVLRKGDAGADKGTKHATEEQAADAHPEEGHATEEKAAAEHGEAAPAEHASEGAERGEEPAEGGDHEGAGESGSPPAPQFVSIDPFVVNINDGERDRFLKLKIDLEVSSADVGKEIEARMPQVKDIMIGLLSSQSFSDVRSMEGKDALREQVQKRLNAVVRTGVVRQVLFTEFVVQ